MMHSRFLVGGLVLSLFFSACGQSSTTSLPAGAAVVTMTPQGFKPGEITITLGQELCFVNDDSEARWPASNDHPTHEILSDFDPGVPVKAGATWCHHFTKAGTWTFHDHLFPEYLGTLIVR